jgi:hypothetical protein
MSQYAGHVGIKCPIIHLASEAPATQNGSENRPKRTPPPANAPTVQNATNAFHAIANAPVNSASPARDKNPMHGSQIRTKSPTMHAK